MVTERTINSRDNRKKACTFLKLGRILQFGEIHHGIPLGTETVPKGCWSIDAC